MKPLKNHATKSYLERRENFYKFYENDRLTRTEYKTHSNLVTNETWKANERYYHNLLISMEN